MRKLQKNKKVRNATPIILNNIQFKSKLEANTYKKLKENNIEIEYEPLKFTLMDKFTFKNKTIRKMTFTPDFIGDNFIIECKGIKTDAFKLKWKLFKWYLKENNLENKYEIYLVNNLKTLETVISEIKSLS